MPGNVHDPHPDLVPSSRNANPSSMLIPRAFLPESVRINAGEGSYEFCFAVIDVPGRSQYQSLHVLRSSRP